MHWESDMQIENGKSYIKCDLCGAKFQFGPHVYEGRRMPSGEMVCAGCAPTIWSAIPPVLGKK